MTPLYTLRIWIGDGEAFGPRQAWTLEHQASAPGRYAVTDGVRVLDGLRFGWSVPDQMWLLQPNAMAAAFQVTMPTFADETWMHDGSPVALEATLRDAAEPFATFYGRLTDCRAVTRTGRTGVTVSFSAVDYSIDPVEARRDEVSVGPIDGLDIDALDLEWSYASLGAFPGFDATPVNIKVPTADPRSFVDQVLLSTVSTRAVPTELLVLPLEAGGGVDDARLILAPNIDPETRLPDAVQPWCFDVLWRTPRAQRVIIPASRLERASLQWERNKRKLPSQLTFTGPGGEYTDYNSAAERPYGSPVSESMSSVCDDLGRISLAANFYLRDYVPTPRGWNVPTARWHLTRGSDVVAAPPLDLFPRWTQPEGHFSRIGYYSRLVELTGLDVNPYAATDHPEVQGYPSAMDLTISGGNLALDLRIRNLEEESGVAP